MLNEFKSNWKSFTNLIDLINGKRIKREDDDDDKTRKYQKLVDDKGKGQKKIIEKHEGKLFLNKFISKMHKKIFAF